MIAKARCTKAAAWTESRFRAGDVCDVVAFYEDYDGEQRISVASLRTDYGTMATLHQDGKTWRTPGGFFQFELTIG